VRAIVVLLRVVEWGVWSRKRLWKGWQAGGYDGLIAVAAAGLLLRGVQNAWERGWVDGGWREGVGLMRVWWLVVVRAVMFVLGVMGVLLVFVGSALAGPAWRVSAEAVPSVVAPGGSGLLLLHVADVGDVSSVAGVPVRVVDQVPAGFVAVRAGTSV
jgi:hypothetical protein